MMSWDDIQAIAFGEMGIDPAVFWKMSLKEWHEKQRGYYLKREMEERQQWERIRWQTWILSLPNAKEGRLNSPTDLVRFPWEKEQFEPLPPEELDYWVRKMGRYITDKGEFVN